MCSASAIPFSSRSRSPRRREVLAGFRLLAFCGAGFRPLRAFGMSAPFDELRVQAAYAVSRRIARDEHRDAQR